MNLQQLHYLCEVAKQGCNITAASLALHTAQSGISKQLKLFENELGAQLFDRKGNRLCGLTPTGEKVLDSARRVANEIEFIKRISQQIGSGDNGEITIATHHTPARYVLPNVLTRFRDLYPSVSVTLRHASPEAILSLVKNGEVDFGVITTNANLDDGDLVALPCHKFERILIVPHGHALLQMRAPSLEAICQYPLITYDVGFSGRAEILKTFKDAGLTPKLVLSVSDADVIKSCVEQGLGIAIVGCVIFDSNRDKGLNAIRINPLFPPAEMKIVLQQRHYFRKFDYDFIETLSAKWHRANVQMSATNRKFFVSSN